MARPRAADHAQHRARILDAGVKAFARAGYASASMAQLAQECGISKAALYHYFSGKEVILFEALDQYTRRLHTVLLDVQARGLSPPQMLTDMVRSLMIEYRDSRDRHVCLLNDMAFLAPAQRKPIEDRQRAIVQCLAEAVDQASPGRFGVHELKPATMALFGMINFTFAWLRPDGPMSYEQYARLVIDLWLGREATSTRLL
jgi:AcrR family transcriptional regulator